MALELNKFYEIQNVQYSTVINLFGEHTGSAIPQGNAITLYSRTGSSDQKWAAYAYANAAKVCPQRNTNYVLNYNTTDASCIAWPLSTATVTDSEIDYMTVDASKNLYRLKLSRRNLYLTATSSTGKLYWRTATNDNTQLFKLLEDGGVTPPSGGIGLSFKRPSGVWMRGFTSAHLGIDYDGAIGDEIRAAGYGKVIYTNNSISTDSSKIESLGRTVYIEHYNANGTVCGMTIYGHLDTINVSKNQTVQEGQKIGTMGNTGYVIPGPGGDGSHLHFALKTGSVFTSDTLYNVYHSGNWANPEPYLR